MESNNVPLNILYGISTDGNGHISRARQVISALEESGANITELFSGSNREPSFDPELFSNAFYRKGYERSKQDGRVNLFNTVAKNVLALPRLGYEIATFDFKPYDLVISDFEPISSLGVRFHNIFSDEHIPSIGLANQYAFEQNVPKVPGVLMNNAHNLARAKIRMGVHFHHFGLQGILPPLIGNIVASPVEKNKILVYLGAENIETVTSFLEQHKKYGFHIYSKEVQAPYVQGHMNFKPISDEEFHKDMQDCEGVITNAGFMTSAEALHLGKKLLLKPISGHPEQHSNALAMQGLDAAFIMESFDDCILKEFLKSSAAKRIHYPDVSRRLSDWIMERSYTHETRNDLCSDLWGQVTYD